MRDLKEEAWLLRKGSAGQLYAYARYIVKCRIPEFEKRLLEIDETGQWLYVYAYYAAGCRISEFEKRLLEVDEEGTWLYQYACYVAKCRIPACERRLNHYGDLYVAAVPF